jgi:hypothetical protein
MATIFVDEAGHTGANLLDSAQPVFVLSTHDFEESEAQKIKAEYFGFVRSQTLKFSQLSRKHKSQQAILRFLDAMSRLHRGRFGTYLIHKPFAVICKLVDHVVESSMHDHGVDLYERGENLALSNLLYLRTKADAGEPYLRRLLGASQQLFTSEVFSVGELLWTLEEQTGLIYGPRKVGGLATLLEVPQLALLDLGPEFLANLGKEDIHLISHGARSDVRLGGKARR